MNEEALQKDAFGRCKTFRQECNFLGKKAGHYIEMRVRHEICRAFSTTEGRAPDSG
jgi:hypothetical protein